ncbi:MAG: HEPN domain-containing protein [Planctomycetales bacterium]|nr:HEPN domain-containing protein [Planctomycetales bacterium]
MDKEIESLLRKARRSLNVSRSLFDQHEYDFAVSRAYYAMHYAVEALLVAKGYVRTKDAALVNSFAKYLVKGGPFSEEHHSALRTAFEQKQVADYEEEGFPRTAAGGILDWAGKLVGEADVWLRKAEGKRK